MNQKEEELPRSLRRLEKLLQKEMHDRDLLKAWGWRLLPYQMEGAEEKMRLSQLFFDTYGQTIAGPCGCSCIIPDHWRLQLEEEYRMKVLIVFSYIYHKKVFQSTPSVSTFARMINCLFDFDCKEKTLAAKIRQYCPANGYDKIDKIL